ncbi:hypothetical protein [Cylindrospermopsis raciborskii]|uniref:hypothetical protein n=1 Tax=Cylindrospermopsis raciborskii TaxID=77022 RepID=UPI001CA528BF|nr:hypothetical protein [Cylindrospermopsis raciborskii]
MIIIPYFPTTLVKTWHPAFLALGKTLDECANIYKGFCQKYRPQPKKVEKTGGGVNF